MSDDLKVTYAHYAGEQFVDTRLIDLCEAMLKDNPSLVYKGGDNKMNYNIPEECKPHGVFHKLNIYDITDPHQIIGQVEVEKYGKKYSISNKNINDGRRDYYGLGQYKQSINVKNIIKIAKKTLKPLTIFQVIETHRRDFEQEIQGLRNQWGWGVDNKTNHAFSLGYEDMIYLHESGYKPKCEKFSQAMEYLAKHKENIDRYANYNPEYCFVWIKPNSVEWVAKDSKEPNVVASLNDLPEHIRGKMFVLDITDEEEFIEDVGLKNSKSCYWVMT